MRGEVGQSSAHPTSWETSNPSREPHSIVIYCILAWPSRCFSCDVHLGSSPQLARTQTGSNTLR